MMLRGLIVSCQAPPGNPLHGPSLMAAMARAAAEGGAAGIRSNGPEDISAVRATVALPIIGLYKRDVEGSEVRITPDLESARAVAAAGADVIALDATGRPRPNGSAAELIAAVRAELGLPVLADVATPAEGVAAARAGADYLATTLSGYTSYTKYTYSPYEPDLALIAELARAVELPVIAEGRFWTPEQVAGAFEVGAAAVVIGSAITNPREITRRFAAAVPGMRRPATRDPG